jgi:hypothetical protein
VIYKNKYGWFLMTFQVGTSVCSTDQMWRWSPWITRSVLPLVAGPCFRDKERTSGERFDGIGFHMISPLFGAYMVLHGDADGCFHGCWWTRIGKLELLNLFMRGVLPADICLCHVMGSRIFPTLGPWVPMILLGSLSWTGERHVFFFRHS